MTVYKLLTAAFAAAMTIVAVTAPQASADKLPVPPATDDSADCVLGLCTAKTASTPSPGNNSRHSSSQPSSTTARRGPSQLETWRRQWVMIERYNRKFEEYNSCLWSSPSSAACVAPNRNEFTLPPDNWAEMHSDNAPTMTPSQAGAIAVARLRLPLTQPKVGPDPNLNKWKMAAVGYPLWVWADGPTHVGPVSDSVGGLSVSLDARLTKTVFQMGDGGTVNCAGTGTPYRSGTAPGTPSPTCGYRYEKPSLPGGNYTVTAVGYWAVTWTVNNTSGVITVPVAASAPLPVGEVQVLVR